MLVPHSVFVFILFVREYQTRPSSIASGGAQAMLSPLATRPGTLRWQDQSQGSLACRPVFSRSHSPSCVRSSPAEVLKHPPTPASIQTNGKTSGVKVALHPAEARTRVVGGTFALKSPVGEVRLEELAVFLERYQRDPAVVFASCMTVAGYPRLAKMHKNQSAKTTCMPTLCHRKVATAIKMHQTPE